jgi:hypothetical protein
MNYVSWKQRQEVSANLKAIYQAPTVEEAESTMSSSMITGTPAIRQSANPGDGTGNGLPRYSRTHRKLHGYL